MEGQIGDQGHLRPWRDHEVFVDEAEAPVEAEDQELERGCGAEEEGFLPGGEDAGGGGERGGRSLSVVVERGEEVGCGA